MFSGVAKREAQKENYERHRTIRLQDDEVSRLNRDIESIYHEIGKARDGVAESRSMLKLRISKLKNALSMIPQKTQLEIATLNALHAKTMRSLRLVHEQNVKEIRNEYDAKLNEIADICTIQEKVEQDQLTDSIDTTRSRIGDILHMNQEKEELRTKVILQRIALKTENDKTRAKQLKREIRKMEKSLEKTRRFAASKEVTMQIEIPEIDTSLEEHTALFEESNMVSEEASFRETSRDELKKLRAKVADAKRRVSKWQTLVDECKANEELDYANEDLKTLEREHEHLISRVQKGDKQVTSKEVSTERTRQKEMRREIRVIKSEMKQIRSENAALLAELRRVSFVVFGPKTKQNPREH